MKTFISQHILLHVTEIWPHVQQRRVCVHYMSHIFKSLRCEKYPCFFDFDTASVIHPSHHTECGICSQTASLRWIWQFPGFVLIAQSWIWHVILSYTLKRESKGETLNPHSASHSLVPLPQWLILVVGLLDQICLLPVTNVDFQAVICLVMGFYCS